MRLLTRRGRARTLFHLATLVTLLCFSFTSVAYAVPARSAPQTPPNDDSLALDRANYKEEGLARPVLLTPTGETTLTSPVFSWSAVPGATRYEFSLDAADGSHVFRRDGIQETSFVIPGEPRLALGRTYSWTVRGFDHRNHLASPYAEVATFTVVAESTNHPPVAVATASPTAGPAPLEVAFDGSASSDPDGDALTFSWDFDSDGGVDATSAAASHTYELPGEYQALLAVSDTDGATSTATVAIDVAIALPAAALEVIPQEIVEGEFALLRWSSTSAGIAVIEPGIGLVAPQGEMAVSPAADTTYTLTVTNASGEARAEAHLKVIHLPPEATLTVAPELVGRAESAVLSWTTRRAQSVTLEGVGPVEPSGAMTVTPSESTTYTLVAANDSGEVRSDVRVRVLPVPSLPEDSFGEAYEDLIPQDATLESYDATRFAVVVGEVLGQDGLPLAAVGVAVHGHAEYGTAMTGQDGRFALPVEGNRSVGLVFSKARYLESFRELVVPWNDFAIAPQMRMVPVDEQTTEVTFDGDSSATIVHRSSETSDAFGDRACTLVFSGDNAAYASQPDGSEVPLASLSVRATEFDTKTAMPAELPANSAFTYCVELSADEATSVRFEGPISMYVDNFLGFPVGQAVPVGWFDRAKGVWVPADNGVVVRLLDTDADGVADALDSTGDGIADDLDHSGSVTDDARGLADPAAYPPGSTFWRVEIDHFTPWDCNWPYGPPSDATNPNGNNRPCPDPQVGCQVQTNSYVSPVDRAFHEDIPIAGSDLTLHYSSDRTRGHQSAVTVQASGSSVPASLKRIDVAFSVAGRRTTTSLPAAPGQATRFTWDGTDAMGRATGGSMDARVTVSFIYPAYYYTPSGFAQAFGQAGTSWTAIQARQEVASERSFTVPIRRYDPSGDIAEGWTISSVDKTAPGDASVLYKGDGTIVENDAMLVRTAAGNGTDTWAGEGAHVSQTGLRPQDVAVSVLGSSLVADNLNRRIIRIDPATNRAYTLAGNGLAAFTQEGLPATQTPMVPVALAVARTGEVFVADSTNCRVFKIGTDGTVRVIAGNGQGAGTPIRDSVPATQSSLYPVDIALDQAQNLYIAEGLGHNRIRKVSSDGTIVTVAGNGAWPYNGDGIATQRSISAAAVDIDRQGNVYIADNRNYRLRKVDPTGRMSTIAGVGTYAYSGTSGDGGPAKQAQVNPIEVMVDSEGLVWLSDSGRHTLRRIDSKGNIDTVMGTPWRSGFSGEDGQVGKATFSYPDAAIQDGKGTFIIADRVNSRVRHVAPLHDYRGIGSMLEVAEADGVMHTLDYQGRHLETADLDTGVILQSLRHSAFGLEAIADRFGAELRVSRDTAGRPTSITAPDGHVTNLSIGPAGRLEAVAYPDGSSYGFTYRADGLMTAERDRVGDEFSHEFDAYGRATGVQDRAGGDWRFSSETGPEGTVRSEVITGEGNRTQYEAGFDAAGARSLITTGPACARYSSTLSADKLVAESDLAGGIKVKTRYAFDPDTHVRDLAEATATMPSGLSLRLAKTRSAADTDLDGSVDSVTRREVLNGRAYTSVMDLEAGTVTWTSPGGRTARVAYDAATLLPTQVQVPGLLPQTYAFDGRGRVTSVTQGARSALVSYDPSGNPSIITMPDGNATSYEYDGMGRPIRETRPDGSQVVYEYDGDGKVTKLVLPSGAAHSFTRTAGSGQRASWTTPLSGAYGYTYDRDRSLTSVMLPSGRQITLGYTYGFNTSFTTPEGTTELLRGKCGRLNAAVRASEVASFTYDGWLVTSDTRKGTVDEAITYSYNPDFQVSAVRYADATETLSYDADSLLVGSGPFQIARNEESGLPETVTAPNQAVSRTFSGYGELDEARYSSPQGDVFSWSATRDAAGRIATKTETTQGGQSVLSYGYDRMGRLASVTRDGLPAEAYAYDAQGNRIAETNTARGATRALAFDAEDRVISAGGDAYSLDVDGFLSSKHTPEGTSTYTYSTRGELLEVHLPGGRLIEYLYDPLGRRIAKRMDGEIAEKYLWRGATTLLAVMNPDDTAKYRFVYADDRVPYACQTATATLSLAYDQVGSLRAVTDESGQVLRSVTYDSFGDVLENTNPALCIPLGFAGGLSDSDTGFVHFGARDYDPELGRWTARDPIDFAGGDANLYGYCVGDPVNWVDPWGLAFDPKGRYYNDWNFQYGTPWGFGGTVGAMWDETYFYPYAGGGAMTPGPSWSFTGSTDCVTPGWNYAWQAAFGFAFAGGAFGQRFNEYGGGTPGASVTGYYVFPGWRPQRPEPIPFPYRDAPGYSRED